MEKFEFNPVRGFEDGSGYPNPSNEAEAREQLMRPSLQLKEFLNNLIETLNSSEGIKEIGTPEGTLEDTLAALVKGNNIKGIRVNDDGSIEYTRDGSTWQTSSSSGHLIMNEYGDLFQQRSRLQFVDATVEDDGEKTIVRGIKGDKGATGPGVPKGGSIGQKLVKKSDTSYDTEWVDDIDSSNPNLLINGDFQVWQRGTSGSGNNANSPFYVADRWQAYSSASSTYTANSKNSDGSMNVAVDGSGTCTFKQILENALPSGNYTISFEVIALTGTVKLYYLDNGSNKHALNVVQGVNTVTVSTTALKEISFYLYGASTLQLKWVKLEQGSINTPFVPRLYVEELAMCKRYYQSFKGNCFVLYEYGDTGYSTYMVSINFDEMRTNPTLGYMAFAYNDVSGTYASSEGFSTLRDSSPSRVQVITNSFATKKHSNCNTIDVFCSLDAEIY